MRSDNATFSELAQRLLDDAARDGSDRASVVRAMERVCTPLSRHLATVMGLDGFSLLLVRALGLAGDEFPWLRSVVAQRDGSLAGLDAATDGCEPDVVAAGFCAVLSHFFGLLVAFIGEDLTLHLLRSIWTDAMPGGEPRQEELT